MNKLTSKFLELGYGKMHYVESGEGDPILFIHGSGPGVSGLANFEDNLSTFSNHFRCIVIDLPGYGKSDPIEGDPIGASVGCIISFLDKMNIESAHIIGNSLGGMLGALIAANNGDRVKSFVTIGGLGMNIFSPFPGEGINLLSAFVEEPSKARIKQWLESMVFDKDLVTDELIESRYNQAIDPIQLETSKKIYAKSSLDAMAKNFRGPEASNRIAHLSSIQAPTLLICGRDDRVTPLDQILLPMRLIPNCETHILPNCGHWAMIEKKEAFESTVLAFLLR